MLRPWTNQEMDYAVRIHPALITGIQLTLPPLSPDN
jgi:hypothetical protein